MFSFIKRFFENRKLKKNLKFFKKFLDELEESFLYVKIISKHPENKLEYLESIKLKEEYSPFINKFNELNSKIKTHNNMVNKINDFVYMFSFSNIIENIEDVKDQELK